jgi:hypothetical protein
MSETRKLTKLFFYKSLVDPLHALKVFVKFFLSGFRLSTESLIGTSLLGALLGLWFVLGSLVAARRNQAAIPFSVFAWCYVAAYSFINKTMFGWYLVPVLPFYISLTWLGGISCAEYLLHHTGWVSFKVVRPALVIAALTVPVAISYLGYYSTNTPSAMQTGYRFMRESVYLKIADQLNQAATPNTILASPEVGALGFAFHGRILDTIGLISPQAIKYNPVFREPSRTEGYGAVPTGLILDAQPDFVVTLDVFAEPTLLQSADFSIQYCCHSSGYTVPGVVTHSTPPIVSHSRPVIVTHSTPPVVTQTVPVDELSLLLHSGTLLELKIRGGPDEKTETIHHGCADVVRPCAEPSIGSRDCPRDETQPHHGKEISHLVRSRRLHNLRAHADLERVTPTATRRLR